MIKEKLLDKDYYLSKYSMFMKESFGMSENIDILLDWMKSINSISTYITNVLDIWNPNYKTDMAKTFGLMYYQRAKDETPSDLRGEFYTGNDISGHDDNGKIFRINNESVEIFNAMYNSPNATPDETYNTIFADKISKKEYRPHIYVANRIVNPNEKFEEGADYYKASTRVDSGYFRFIKEPTSPKIEGLYEKTTLNRYILSQDDAYNADKNYYIFNSSNRTYTLATPSLLGLYKGDYYYIEYSNEFIEVSPKYLGLYVKSPSNEYIPSGDTSFNSDINYYISTYIYDNETGNYSTSMVEASPILMTLPLYEKNENEYIETDDENFETNKSYYINFKFTYKKNSEGTLTGLHKFSPSYKLLSPSENEPGNGQQFKMLDVIASIIGCSRYNNIIRNGKVETLEPLSNEDLLDLIKIKIIQNNYKGTTKEIIDLYREKLNYNIYLTLEKQTYYDEQSHTNIEGYVSANCRVYLEDIMMDDDGNSYYISENIKKLFKYSDLFIQSVGISYTKACISDIGLILMLDTNYLSYNEKAVYTADEEEQANTRTSSIKLG